MKRLIWLLSASVVVGGVCADLAVEVENQGSAYYVEDGSTEVNEALVQLIWAEDLTGEAGIGGALDPGAGEYLLHSFVTFAGVAGTWDSNFDSFAGLKFFDDSSVGGAGGSDTEILDGYFFYRVYDNAATQENDYYLQQNVRGPALTRYNSQEPSTIYDDGVFGGTIGPSTPGALQVVPEPAVASLIALFGGGLLISRRIFSRS